MTTIQPTKSSSTVKNKRNHQMERSTGKDRKRPSGSLKSSGSTRRVRITPNNVTKKSIVSPREARPLPPLKKINGQCQKSTPSPYQQMLPKPKLPPIKQAAHQLEHENADSIQRNHQMSTTMINYGNVEDVAEEDFVPLRISTPNNSQLSLRATNSRTLPKPNYVTFQQNPSTDDQLKIRSVALQRPSESTSVYESYSVSDVHHDGAFNAKERRRLNRSKTKQWVRVSNFALKTVAEDDSAQAITETDSYSTVSSITFDDGRDPGERSKPTSMEQLRRVMSKLQPPPLPFTISVHERVSKLNVDVQFRFQHLKDRWGKIHFSLRQSWRLPKISIDIDFARKREAVRRFCARLRNSLRFPPPLILDPPRKFVIIPPSAWHLNPSLTRATDEGDHLKMQSLKQYNRKMSCFYEGDVAMVAEGNSFKRRRRLRRNFADEKRDDNTSGRKAKPIPSSSGQTLAEENRRPLPVLPKEFEASQVEFDSARERLASVLKKMDDPSWFATWIAKHDEMDGDIRRLQRKRLDLIRALTFTVENEPCQRRTVLGRVQATDATETRERMRIHHQYAHHRFGMPQRYPTILQQPPLYADASAVGSESVVHAQNKQPHHQTYIDERPGCIACRVMKAARRHGCEDRLTELATLPKIENYYRGGDVGLN